MEKSAEQVEKNVSASFAYVKKDMLMLNDAFSDLHDKMQHLSLNHAMLLEEIGKLRTEMAKTSGKKVPEKKSAKKKVSKKKDDLTKIEGVGPAIRKLLNKYKIMSFKDLSKVSVKDLRDVLDSKGSMYSMHDPTTWVKQAKLASQEKWEELEKYQAELDGGIKKKVAKKKPANKKVKKIVKETVTYE
jgi:predicted flap endonuclease-1-like 5' DNA nuclease